jgi:hypothetical protein
MHQRSMFFFNSAFMGTILLSFTLFASSPVSAKRSFKEDPLIKKTVKQAGAGQMKRIFKKEKKLNQCKGVELGSRELSSVVCRLKAFRHLTQKSPINTAWEVKHKAKMAQAAYQTGISIDTYEPIDPPPNFIGLQYESAETVCGILQDVLENLSSIRPSKKNKEAFNTAQETLEGVQMGPRDRGLREALCSCSKMWLNAADKAFKSMEEKGAIQRVLTSRGCFLDMKKAKIALSTDRKAGPVKLSGNIGAVAAQNSDTQKIKDYAATRDFTLKRCRAKIGDTKIDDPKKVQKCLCREIKRWRFPSHDANINTVTTVLPIEKDLVGLRVNISPKGKVEQCGPLEGPKVPPLKP